MAALKGYLIHNKVSWCETKARTNEPVIDEDGSARTQTFVQVELPGVMEGAHIRVPESALIAFDPIYYHNKSCVHSSRLDMESDDNLLSTVWQTVSIQWPKLERYLKPWLKKLMTLLRTRTIYPPCLCGAPNRVARQRTRKGRGCVCTVVCTKTTRCPVLAIVGPEHKRGGYPSCPVCRLGSNRTSYFWKGSLCPDKDGLGFEYLLCGVCFQWSSKASIWKRELLLQYLGDTDV
jgi:hypothetical protein